MDIIYNKRKDRNMTSDIIQPAGIKSTVTSLNKD